MASKNKSNILIWLFLIIGGGWLITSITACGKTAASQAGLNIRYEVLNLSPDLLPVNLFISFKQVNALGNPFVFNVNPGYFYLPATDTPFQIRSNLTSGITLFSRDDILKPNATYSLFITGSLGDNSLKQIFTVDTASLPTIGRGKIRFIDASPTGTSGLDVYANGEKAFSKIIYPNFSDFVEIPVGNYDFQITTTGQTNILKDLPAVTIQDGRLYTIYAYGYTNRIDSAAFSAQVITNR
jgi:hypothetical protein